MSNTKKRKKKEPAPWKPVNLEEFNKNTKVISEMFKSDPKRLNESQNNNDDNTE